MRLDKLLANMGIYGSRKDVKQILKKKRVTVNERIIKDGSIHVEPNQDIIKVDGEPVLYREFIYIMMNKPQGVISATEDDEQRTVVDLLEPRLQHFKPFPVGRLDKDTEGLLLLTNDGKLAHRLLSPKQDVEKKYYAKISGKVTEIDIEKFSQGIVLDDGYHTKPSKLKILSSDEISEVEVIITEGKYHQVKRMFAAVNKKVLFLKRLEMGKIILDPSLKPGTYRLLNKQELEYCQLLQ